MMTHQLPTESPRRWQLAVAVLLFIGAAAGVLAYEARARLTEATRATAAGATLRYLALRMEAFRAAAIVDQDGDGRGEYPYLAELTGLARPRAGDGLAPSPCANFLVRTILGESALAQNGVATKDGYCFRVFLGAGDGSARPDPGLPTSGASDDADAQEERFTIYAWPADGSSGETIQVITEDQRLMRSGTGGRFVGTGRQPRLDLYPGEGEWMEVNE